VGRWRDQQQVTVGAGRRESKQPVEAWHAREPHLPLGQQGGGAIAGDRLQFPPGGDGEEVDWQRVERDPLGAGGEVVAKVGEAGRHGPPAGDSRGSGGVDVEPGRDRVRAGEQRELPLTAAVGKQAVAETVGGESVPLGSVAFEDEPGVDVRPVAPEVAEQVFCVVVGNAGAVHQEPCAGEAVRYPRREVDGRTDGGDRAIAKGGAGGRSYGPARRLLDNSLIAVQSQFEAPAQRDPRDAPAQHRLTEPVHRLGLPVHHRDLVAAARERLVWPPALVVVQEAFEPPRPDRAGR